MKARYWPCRGVNPAVGMSAVGLRDTSASLCGEARGGVHESPCEGPAEGARLSLPRCMFCALSRDKILLKLDKIEAAGLINSSLQPQSRALRSRRPDTRARVGRGGGSGSRRRAQRLREDFHRYRLLPPPGDVPRTSTQPLLLALRPRRSRLSSSRRVCEVPLLQKLHIKNYRSIAEATVELRPFTMLVGANG